MIIRNFKRASVLAFCEDGTINSNKRKRLRILFKKLVKIGNKPQKILGMERERFGY